MKVVGPVLLALVVASFTACGGDDSSPAVAEEAVVRVYTTEPQPAIASICIGSTCQTFSEVEDARSAEFSLAIDALLPVEVLLVGDEPGFGTGSDIGPGGCMTVTYSDAGIVVDAGCGETDG